MSAKKGFLSRVLTVGILGMSFLGGQTIHAKQTSQKDKDPWAVIKNFGFKEMDSMMIMDCYKNPEKYVDCVVAAGSLIDASITTQAEINDYQIKIKKILFTSGSLILAEVEDDSGTIPDRHKNLKDKELLRAQINDHRSAIEATVSEAPYILPDLVFFIRDQAKEAGKTEAQITAEFVSAVYQNDDAYFNLVPASFYTDSMSDASQDSTILGISFVPRIKIPVIHSVVKNSAAAAAGLRQGDRVLSFNGISAEGMSGEQVTEVLRKNKTVTLEVRRKEQKISLSITRANVHVPNVTSNLIGDQGKTYLSIKFLSFMEQNGCKSISDAIQSAQRKAKIDGIILDLRENGGGLLPQAVCIASLFLPENKVVTVVKPLNGSQSEALLTYDNRTMKSLELARTDLPLVVLVNGHSASASEVLTGALRDYKRIWLVGDRTYGKGSVMSVGPFAPNPDLYLVQTTAIFYQPDGTTNQMVGITPDFQVRSGPFATEQDDAVLRNEDRLVGKLPPAANKIVQTKRIREIVKVNQCLNHKALLAKYNSKFGTQDEPDYQLMFATEVLRCN